MSMTLSKKVLEKFKKNNNIFIETGTYKGGAIELAIECKFSKIISIDISNKFKEECNNKFIENINKNQVELIYGDVVDVLPDVIKKINEPCLFWLDSHFDGNSDVCGKYVCPLLHELDIIGSSNIRSHTIMIDDMRILKNKTDWALEINFENVVEKLKEINFNYNFYYDDGCEKNDILIAKI